MITNAPDPVTVLRVSHAAHPGAAAFFLCPRSLAARYAAEAAGDDQVTDLGPGALLLAQAAQRERAAYGKGVVLLIGVAYRDRWLHWYPPAPVEPVPGSPGDTAQRN
jgi:hypothetical protein